MAQFKNLIFKALESEKSNFPKSPYARALLKMLLEIRESAKKNEDYEEYDKITSDLEKIGITLHEQMRITARIKED